MSENKDSYLFLFDEKSSPSIVRFILQIYALPVESYPFNEWVKVAHIPRKSSDQGFCVEIFELRMPAAFYKICVLGHHDPSGAYRAGYEMQTGSGPGVGEMAARMAAAISEGVLALRRTL